MLLKPKEKHHPMANEPLLDRDDVRELVKQRYGEAALRVLSARRRRGGSSCRSCCGGDASEGACCGDKPADGCCANTDDPITSNLYSGTEAAEIPEAALLASLGCGNPTALAQLGDGEVVLDLGSGGGIDVLLSARRVGPTGFAYGLDMTDAMLALAEMNRQEAGAENVRFLKGHIEDIPLPDGSVDVIISNCVINLSADKGQVLREAFRVLKPGGRFAVSDVVVDGALPSQVRRDMELYVGCVAGALDRQEYLDLLAAAGFVEADIEPTRRYRFSDLVPLPSDRRYGPTDPRWQGDGRVHPRDEAAVSLTRALSQGRQRENGVPVARCGPGGRPHPRRGAEQRGSAGAVGEVRIEPPVHDLEALGGLELFCRRSEPLVVEFALRHVHQQACGVACSGVGERVGCDQIAPSLRGKHPVQRFPTEMVYSLLLDQRLEFGGIARVGEHEVAALDVRLHLREPQRFEERAQVCHRQAVLAAHVHSPDEADVPVHAQASSRMTSGTSMPRAFE